MLVRTVDVRHRIDQITAGAVVDALGALLAAAGASCLLVLALTVAIDLARPDAWGRPISWQPPAPIVYVVPTAEPVVAPVAVPAVADAAVEAPDAQGSATDAGES
jgi:hypothetical protein